MVGVEHRELLRLSRELAVLVVGSRGDHVAVDVGARRSALGDAEGAHVAHPASLADVAVLVGRDRTPVGDHAEVTGGDDGRTQYGRCTIEGLHPSEDRHRAVEVHRVLTEEDLAGGVLVLFLLLRTARATDLDLGLCLGQGLDVTVSLEVVRELDLFGVQYRDAGALGEEDRRRGIRLRAGRHDGVEVRTVGAGDAERHGALDGCLGNRLAGLLDILLIPDLNNRRVHHVNVTTHPVLAGLDELAAHDVVDVLVELELAVPLQDGRHLDGPLETADDVAVLAGVADHAAGHGDHDGCAVRLLGDRLRLPRAGGVPHLEVRRVPDGLLGHLDVVVRAPPGQLRGSTHGQTLTLLD